MSAPSGRPPWTLRACLTSTPPGLIITPVVTRRTTPWLSFDCGSPPIAVPARFADGLRDKPAPHWGLVAVVLRGLIDSLLLYLPIYLMGWQPPIPSFIPIFSTEHYYRTLIFIGPLLFLAHWLMSGALTHVVLRLTRRRSDKVSI